MSRHGWTEKPCPACGSTEGRSKDKLCYVCQRIYNDGLLAREKQESQQEKIAVRHDRAYHLIAGPFLFEHSTTFLSSQLNDMLRHAWHKLTMSVLEPAVGEKPRESPYLVSNKEGTWGVRNEFYGYHDDEHYLVKPEVREAVNELDLAMRLSLEFVYLAGQRQGSNILLRLNEGKVSSSSLEDRSNEVESRLEQLKQRVSKQRSKGER